MENPAVPSGIEPDEGPELAVLGVDFLAGNGVAPDFRPHITSTWVGHYCVITPGHFPAVANIISTTWLLAARIPPPFAGSSISASPTK